MPAIRTCLAAVLVAVVLVGCSADEPGGSGPSGAPDHSGYPVTIESALGTAVIEAASERIVTIGHGAADTVFALGHVPVGVEADLWGGDQDGYHPWLREAIEGAGAELPATFAAYPELDLDAIVALQPDLILAPQSRPDPGRLRCAQ